MTTTTHNRFNIMNLLKKRNSNKTKRVLIPAPAENGTENRTETRNARTLTVAERDAILNTDTQPLTIVVPSIVEETEAVLEAHKSSQSVSLDTEPLNMAELFIEQQKQMEQARVSKDVVTEILDQQPHVYTVNEALGFSDSGIYVSRKMRRQTKRSIFQKIVTSFLFVPFMVFPVSFIALLFVFPVNNLEMLPQAAMRALIPTIIFTLLWASTVIPFSILRNLQLKAYCANLASAFNTRYGSDLSPSQVYELLNDFRIPINVGEQRHEIYLSTLPQGLDARLLIRDTGSELPIKFPATKTTSLEETVVQ